MLYVPILEANIVSTTTSEPYKKNMPDVSGDPSEFSIEKLIAVVQVVGFLVHKLVTPKISWSYDFMLYVWGVLIAAGVITKPRQGSAGGGGAGHIDANATQAEVVEQKKNPLLGQQLDKVSSQVGLCTYERTVKLAGQPP